MRLNLENKGLRLHGKRKVHIISINACRQPPHYLHCDKGTVLHFWERRQFALLPKDYIYIKKMCVLKFKRVSVALHYNWKQGDRAGLGLSEGDKRHLPTEYRIDHRAAVGGRMATL